MNAGSNSTISIDVTPANVGPSHHYQYCESCEEWRKITTLGGFGYTRCFYCGEWGEETTDPPGDAEEWDEVVEYEGLAMLTRLKT